VYAPKISSTSGVYGGVFKTAGTLACFQLSSTFGVKVNGWDPSFLSHARQMPLFQIDHATSNSIVCHIQQTCHRVPMPVDKPDSRLAQSPMVLIQQPKVQYLSPSIWRLRFNRSCRRLVSGVWMRPAVHGVALNHATVQKLSPHQQHQFPIEKKPLPLHRFSLETRQRLRRLIAERHQLAPVDVQLVGIYDRISPQLYQTIVQQEDGTLKCILKSSQRLNADAAVVYVMVGKSLRQPGRSLQMALPVNEVHAP
jgi:hypothetical protein